MKKFLLNYIKKLIIFFNSRLKLKTQPLSPADLYFEEVAKDSYEIFKIHFKESYVFSDEDSIRNFAINEATKMFDKRNLFLEFGVFKGESINLFAKNLKNIGAKIIGFDSFKGLKEEWITEEYNPKGTFNLMGDKPKVQNNVNLIDGWVEETLINFLSTNKSKIAFVHLDLDTYASTLFVLNSLKKNFQKGTIILFDEFYGFPNWEKHEFKALKESLNSDKFKYIAFGTRQACIKIL